MSYLFQINDPEELQITIQIPGKYNPDILEDGKNRLVAAYKEALAAHQAAAFSRAEPAVQEGEDE